MCASIRRYLPAALLGLSLVLGARDMAGAEEKKTTEPLWEAGLAGGAGWVPDYPAAGQNHAQGLVLPYVIYRGKYLRAGDDKGIVRGRFMPSDQVELDLSLSASLPTDSDENEARQGMPDLDYLLEAGPRLQITLARLSPDRKIDFELPVRAIFSSDMTDFHYRGVVSLPELAFQDNDLGDTGVRMKLGIGPIFASDRFMEYLYGVEPQYVTAERPEYDAGGGYLGSKLKLLLAKKLTPQVRLYGTAFIGYYDGATNEESPLYRKDLNAGVGFGLVWALFQSQETTRE